MKKHKQTVFNSKEKDQIRDINKVIGNKCSTFDATVRDWHNANGDRKQHKYQKLITQNGFLKQYAKDTLSTMKLLSEKLEASVRVT